MGSIVTGLLAFGVMVVALGGVGYTTELTIPETATIIDMERLPCNALFVYYDTDGHPENGAELLGLFQDDDLEYKHPLVIIQFDTGELKEFKTAVVSIPNEPKVTFNSFESLTDTYSGPCDVVHAASKKKI